MEDEAITAAIRTLLYRCANQPAYEPPKGGHPCGLTMTETADSVKARVKYAINKIVCDSQGKIPFVIAHGGIIREFARQWGIGNTKMQNMGMIGIVVKDGKPEAFNLTVPHLEHQATMVSNQESVVAQHIEPNLTLENKLLGTFLHEHSNHSRIRKHVFVLMRHAVSSNNFLRSPKKLRKQGIEPAASKYALALSKTAPMLGQDAKLMMTENEKAKGKSVGAACREYATELQFFVSPMLRTLQTFALIAHGMEDINNRPLPHTPPSFFRPFKPRFREFCDPNEADQTDPILTFDAFKQAGDLADGGFKGLKKPRSFALYNTNENDYLLRYSKKEGEKDICKGVVRLDAYEKRMLLSILQLLEKNQNDTFPLFFTQPNLWITGPVTNTNTKQTEEQDSVNVPPNDVIVVEELQEVRKSVSDDIKHSRSVSDLDLEHILDKHPPPISLKPILYYLFLRQTRNVRRCTSDVDTSGAASVTIGLHKRKGTLLTDDQIDKITDAYPEIDLGALPDDLDEMIDDGNLDVL